MHARGGSAVFLRRTTGGAEYGDIRTLRGRPEGFAVRGSNHSVGFGWTPAPCCQFNTNFGLQHSSEKFFTGITRSDTTFSWDVSAEVRVLETSWSVIGDYDFTHFSSTGRHANGIEIGFRYSFGETFLERETKGPAFASFTQLLGANYTF
jgi:hypothetical protein